MWLNHLRLNSIKTRVTLYIITLFIVSIWLIAFNANRKLERELTEQITKQQESSNTMLAEEIGDQLRERMITLESISVKISQIGLEKSHVIEDFLEDRFVIKRDYNSGAFVTNSRGSVIASASGAIRQENVNFLERDSIQLALKENT